MVKIRYSELPSGLHVTAEAQPRDTVVYLQPGLTPAQRRDALIRVRSSARMGQGPALSGLAMARAIAADRVRTTARIGAAAMRRHPMLLMSPVTALVVSAVAFMSMSAAPRPGGGHARNPDAVPALHVNAGHTSATPTPSPTGGVQRPAHSRHVHRPRSLSAPSSGTWTSWSAPTLGPIPTPTASPTPSPWPSATPTCIKPGPLGLCVPT